MGALSINLVATVRPADRYAVRRYCSSQYHFAERHLDSNRSSIQRGSWRILAFSSTSWRRISDDKSMGAIEGLESIRAGQTHLPIDIERSAQYTYAPRITSPISIRSATSIPDVISANAVYAPSKWTFHP